jgi:hypothetical protein
MGIMSEVHDVMDTIAELADCATEAEAAVLVRDVVEMLGAQWFVYTTLLPTAFGEANESLRYFIGCSQELCKVYSKRMWCMNDPFFEYARSNSAPILGSKIKVQTSGQAEMMRVSAELGFRSGLVVPTHTSMGSGKRMGLLYVGSEDPAEVAEPQFLRKRVQYGALGTELLLWWNARLRKQAMRKYSLLERDVEMLQLSRRGKVACEIAALYDMKIAAVYKRLNAIKERFDVERIEQAVRHAEAEGILE